VLNFGFDQSGRSLNSPASELEPAIASRYIVFMSDRNGSQDIYLYDAQERRLSSLPDLNSFDMIASHPSISEDGRYVVFAASRRGRKTDIYLYDRETKVTRNLTENLPAEVRNPTLSADGTTIAFETSEDGHWDIAIYDRSGEPVSVNGE
jgi:beta propeller repeat protein